MKPSKASGSKKRGKRKRKPSSPSPPQIQTPNAAAAAAAIEPQVKVGLEEDDEERRQTLDIDWLMGAFSSVSLDDIASAYAEAGLDAFKAAGILGAQLEDPGEAAAAEEVVIEEKKRRQQQQQKKRIDEERKQKRVAASSGMVANVIGKGYAKRGSNCGGGGGREGKREVNEGYVNWNGKGRVYTVEEGEEFLCSMLGDNSELGMGVVKDVLCQYGCDVEKALDVLLDLSASSFNQFTESDGGSYSCTYPELSSLGLHENSIYSFQSTDETPDSTYHPSEIENDILQYVGYGCRDDTRSLVSTEEQPCPSSRAVNPALQQKVLESLFSIPDYHKHEPNRMNWKKVVQQVESFGQGLEYRNGVTEPLLNVRNDDEYQLCRSAAGKHWDTMRCYYQKAAVAYSRGDRAHAAQLSETGRIHGSLARKADEKASREIFEARNKDIKNTVTIDLHGQHVKQGIGLLKLHLLLFTYIPSVQFLKVITGCGGDGNGKGKLKRSVVSLVNKEGIEWCEENSGTLLLKVDGLKEYSFTEEDENDSDES